MTQLRFNSADEPSYGQCAEAQEGAGLDSVRCCAAKPRHGSAPTPAAWPKCSKK